MTGLDGDPLDRPPGLSVCCLTADEPVVVASMLRCFVGVADEIVVAVDSSLDPGLLAPLIDVADRVVRFEYVHPPERSRPWLVGLCRHQTVLMIDGDEVPSSRLLAQLPAIAADDTMVQHRLVRRWTYPDERYWLAERPWWPDFQTRIFRVDASLDFDLRVHGGVRPATPVRNLDAPLYHLACQVAPFAERRARARTYEADRPGLAAIGGGSMNDILYAPEHFATLPLQPTPPDDLARLREVLAAGAEGHTAQTQSVDALPVVSAAEIAANQGEDPLDGHGYRADVRIAELDCRTDPGNDTMVLVDVTNDMAVTLPRLDTRGLQIRLVTRLLHSDSEQPLGPWALTPLPCDVPAGESRLAEVLVRIPEIRGCYILDVGLLNERGRWFECRDRREMLVADRWGRFASNMW